MAGISGNLASFRIVGLKKWMRALRSSDFQRHLKKTMPPALMVAAKFASAEQRKLIQGKGVSFKRNAALTTAMKGGDAPLVGDGDLFQAITEKADGDFEVFSGVLRTSEDVINVAETIHDGATINVSEKMRGLFFVLWKASQGEEVSLEGRAAELFAAYQGWLPLAKATTKIVIPRRPWVERTFGLKRLQKNAKKVMEKGIEEALKMAAEKR